MSVSDYVVWMIFLSQRYVLFYASRILQAKQIAEVILLSFLVPICLTRQLLLSQFKKKTWNSHFRLFYGRIFPDPKQPAAKPVAS